MGLDVLHVFPFYFFHFFFSFFICQSIKREPVGGISRRKLRWEWWLWQITPCHGFTVCLSKAASKEKKAGIEDGSIPDWINPLRVVATYTNTRVFIKSSRWSLKTENPLNALGHRWCFNKFETHVNTRPVSIRHPIERYYNSWKNHWASNESDKTVDWSCFGVNFEANEIN